MKELCAIILAAGKGVRMKSALAKVLHPILGRPMISYPVDACRKAGAGEIVVVVGHLGEEVSRALGGGVTTVRQERQLGTADAVNAARGILAGREGTALILCGDTPLLTASTLSALLARHQDDGALVTVLTANLPDPKGYGRIVRDGAGKAVSIVEEKDANPAAKAIKEINTGTYAVNLPWLWETLRGISNANSQGEFYLTDMVAAAAGEGRVSTVPAADPAESMGINSRAQLAEAADAMRIRINREWMDAGVSFLDPSTALVEPGVELAEDITIGPSVMLTGNTRIGRNSVIEAGSIVNDTQIGEGVRIKPYSVLDGAELEDGVAVGPFANLRPGAKLMSGARVGNFVEIKKSTLGPGVKANHLSYIGDAEIGEGTNVGAGTITCNYDGKNKHRTVVGKGAFIGSNTSLVAPVMVGDGAIVGAGSTITRDVPPEALSVTRAPQKTIEGWKRRAVKKSGED